MAQILQIEAMIKNGTEARSCTGECACSLGIAFTKTMGGFPMSGTSFLEVKLQTSPTIDLGLILPNSMETIDLPQNAGQQIRYCDTRYALFCAKIDEGRVALTHLLVTTGGTIL